MTKSMFALARPALFRMAAERAHTLTIDALAAWGGIGAGAPRRLPVRIAGIGFPNPLGLAAGADKDARAVPAWWGLGFGAVEVGTLTPRPQAGNPRPRLFRLPEDEAVVNRMGFNNGGLTAALARLPGPGRRGVLGVNVGANKDSTDRVADYAEGVARAAVLADYVTINVSSPNTPGLRDLQHGAALIELIAAADAARREGQRRTPLFLKVAPDLERGEIDSIARAEMEGGIDALIVSNTTVSRPGTLRSAAAGETGGLSGAPLAVLARARLAEFRSATGGRLPLISAGGVGSAEEAYARIRGGASAVQVYSALVYQGPGLARRIVRGLAALLARDGFADVAEAVGA